MLCYLSGSERKERDSNLTSAVPVQCSTSLAIRPTGNWSFLDKRVDSEISFQLWMELNNSNVDSEIVAIHHSNKISLIKTLGWVTTLDKGYCVCLLRGRVREHPVLDRLRFHINQPHWVETRNYQQRFQQLPVFVRKRHYENPKLSRDLFFYHILFAAERKLWFLFNHCVSST